MPFVLRGYSSSAAMWPAFRRNRLDAVLVEGPELDRGTLEALPDSTVWGRETGGQQIVLRLSPGFSESLGQGGREALSRALPRRDVAAAYPDGRLIPAEGFLVAVGAPPAPRGSALESDARLARRTWLSQERSIGRPSLAVIDFPALVGLAAVIAAQWQRTLNLSVTVAPVAVDRFERERQAWRHDAYLTVVDLDDGSLQDLWREALGGRPWEADPQTGAPPPEQIANWEAEFLERLPYLPVLQNAHWVAAKGEQAAARIRAICPGCRVPAPPPEARARSDTPSRRNRDPIEG